MPLTRRPPAGRGCFVVFAGPDGVGKTTVAALIAGTAGRPTAYFHFRPLVWSPLLAAPPVGNPPNPDKGAPHGFAPLGWLRIARNFVRLWAGYLVRVRPAVRRGVLVMGDRWGYGYLAQPRALKFYGPRWLAGLVVRALPHPDLVVNLAAAPEVVAARKDELTPAEIAAELGRWAAVPARRMQTFDAGGSPEAVAAAVLAAIDG